MTEQLTQGWVLVFPDGEVSAVYSLRGHAEYAAQQHDPEPEIVELRPDATGQLASVKDNP